MAESQDDVSALQAAIQDLGYRTSSARETVEQANVIFDVFKVLLLFFGSIAVVVAFVGMFNTLTISLLEKTREVGMMRALGATHRDVQRLFLTEALIIGILGGVSGVVLALLTGLAVNGGVAVLAGVTGNEPATIFYSPALMVAAMFVIASVSSFLTGLYPARRAAKTKILDALRYE
jgi:ABC-type antimicrobial peptide transport system permease subunit